MVTLVSLGEEEFTDFFELAVSTYAKENVLGGRWLAPDAEALARAETTRLLPHGIATPDHHLYGIAHASRTAAVGYVWFCEMQRGSARIAYVVQVLVLAEHRGRGYARAALQIVEEIATSKGLSSLALHVFAHNKAASALYKSLGYEVSSLNLIRPLAARET